MGMTTLPPSQRLTKNEAACLEALSDGGWHLLSDSGPLSLNTIASLQRKGYVESDRFDGGVTGARINDSGRRRIEQTKDRERR